MAKLVHLVGTSNSGKTTTIKSLSDRLVGYGLSVRTLQEPGPLRLLAKAYNSKKNKKPWLEAAIYSVDRYMLYSKEVLPRLKEERLIFLFDRGLPDSVIRQGILGGVNVLSILKMNSEIPPANLYLNLIVDGEVGYQRALRKLKETGEAPSLNETIRAIDRLSDAYKQVSDYFQHVHLIDTSKLTKNQVIQQCYDEVKLIL